MRIFPPKTGEHHGLQMFSLLLASLVTHWNVGWAQNAMVYRCVLLPASEAREDSLSWWRSNVSVGAMVTLKQFYDSLLTAERPHYWTKTQIDLWASVCKSPLSDEIYARLLATFSSNGSGLTFEEFIRFYWGLSLSAPGEFTTCLTSMSESLRTAQSHK